MKKVDLTTILETNEAFRKSVLQENKLTLRNKFGITFVQAEQLQIMAALIECKK